MNKVRATLSWVVVIHVCLALANGWALAETGTGEEDWAAASAAAQSDEARVFVREFRWSPSEILSEDEIGAIVGPYEGRYLTFAELSEVVDELNRLYHEKGFFTARAMLPPQTIEEGVVWLSLVEGRVGDVVVEGNAYTRTGYITKWMRLKSGDLLEVSTLEADLIRFNSANGVQVTATLRAGEQPGTTDYVLKVYEPKRWRTDVSYGNSGRRETGEHQVTLTVSNQSLLGYSDPLSLTLTAGAGSRSGSASYSIPVGTWGSRVELNYSQAHMRFVEGSFAGVQLEVASQRAAVAWKQPLRWRPGFRAALNLEHRQHRSDTSMLGSKVSGAQGQGTTLAFDMLFGNGRREISLRPSVTTGSTTTDFEATQYVKGNLGLAVDWRVAERYQVALRLNGQYTVSTLLPESEEMLVAGEGAVRGFAPGAYTGPIGYAASVEFRPPQWRRVQGYAFVDFGSTWSISSSGGVSPEATVASAGIGADVAVYNNWSASLNYAVPLKPEAQPLSRGYLQFRLTASF